ncbi:MAG: hypothetical protein IKE55_03435 [Kiritimatiellae bacterium]|nr:hypothetical protein [Kiritimatiellia bacterium]
MKKLLWALCAVASCSLAEAADYSRIAVNVSALPKEGQFLRGIVLSRVWNRTLPSDAARTLTVTFAVDGSLTGENAVVKVADGRAEVRGGRFRALVFGAGTLLRAMRYGEKTFSLEDGEYAFSPAKPYRIAYFARHFNNWYLKASADELLRYVEDLALWGLNGFHMQLDYPIVDTVWSTAGDRAVFAATSVALGERIHALDMYLSTSGGSNCAPEDMPPQFRATKDPKGSRGADAYNVCPEKPGALDYLLKIRQAANDKTKHLPVSGVVYWPFDEGGCACEKCAPWGGRGYVKLIERFSKLNEKTYPDVKHIVSTWFFRDDDWEAFYGYLKNQDWIDALVIDAHRDFPRYPLEHPLPKDIPVITFPEISMWGRFPWGGTGANPLPARFERLYRQCEAIVSGFMLYSEGIYEDVNKIVINGLYVNPKATHDDVLREYARWELPGCDERDFVALCAKLEENYETQSMNKVRGRKGYRMSRFLGEMSAEEQTRRVAVAREAVALADRIDGMILPQMRRNWRWRQIYLRAKIDEAVYSASDIRTPAAMPAYEELMNLYHAEKQMERLLDGTWKGYTCPPFADQP